MKKNYFYLFMMSILIGAFISQPSQIFAQEYSERISKVNQDIALFGENEEFTRPTFGKAHEKNKTIVENGFIVNNQTFNISNNFHTPFVEQSIKLGMINFFESKVFAPKGLMVQEFLFGIPQIGDAHLSETAVEIWFDRNGEIENFKTKQESNIIDENTIEVTHKKTKCKITDIEENCDLVSISVMFLEPLKDKVMAIKAIDYKNRYQITYLNEGFNISDKSLNPLPSLMIPSPAKGEGLLQVYQIEKYSPLWSTIDGRVFERNNFGSFKQINIVFERFQDSGEPLTRNHSGFKSIMSNEMEKALKIFNATILESELPESHTIENPIGERITFQMQQKMLEQSQIAEKILDDLQIQARFY